MDAAESQAARILNLEAEVDILSMAFAGLVNALVVNSTLPERSVETILATIDRAVDDVEFSSEDRRVRQSRVAEAMREVISGTQAKVAEIRASASE